MSAFIYNLTLRVRLDIRNKGVLITYYVIPLLFFAFMGAIFSSINPTSKDTLIQSLTVFGVSMGALLGAPLPIVELYGSEIKKAYKVGGIPIWIPAVNNFISATFHLFIVSIVIFFVAPVAFSAKLPSNMLVYFVSLLIFIMTSISIGTLLGLLVKSVSKLTMLTQAIFLPSLMLSGIMFPASMLPKVVENVGKIFPATQGFMVMTSNEFSFNSIGVLLIILASAIIINGTVLSKIAKRR